MSQPPKSLRTIMKPVQRLSHWCNTVEASLILLLILFILRIPNLAEPYWYGDEAIYLTIGSALRQGVELYAGIVDHKTPLIYYLAMTPTQLWFRILMLVWMSVTTLLFYGVARKLFTNTKVAFGSGLIFVLLSSWPGLEGNIPNGELFVMGFIIASLWVITRTHLFADWMKGKNLAEYTFSRADTQKFIGSGMLASLGLLTKVPAILDIGALGLLLILPLIPLVRKQVGSSVVKTLTIGSTFALGVVIPVVLSIVYYFFKGNLDAYLQFGLLYNFHYVGTWVPEFPSPIVAFFFTLPGKALLLIAGFVATTFFAWHAPKKRLLPWATFWLLTTLFASLLSNRPYPHYFLQLVPPFALFVPALLLAKRQLGAQITGVAAILLIVVAALFLNFGFYPTISYYQRYISLVTGKIQPQEYAQQFNGIIGQNQQVAEEIVSNSTPDDRIFIWGTNPMLYALTQRVPASRFTVAFHIHDLKVYDETLQEIQTQQPAYIVVMRNESAWPEFEDYLYDNYLLTTTTDDMMVYRRTRLTGLLLE